MGLKTTIVVHTAAAAVADVDAGDDALCVFVRVCVCLTVCMCVCLFLVI